MRELEGRVVPATFTVTSTDTTPVDPLLGPLGSYGGTVVTIPLLPGSPAINAGSKTGNLTIDARGLARNVGGTDIGAFELQPGVLSLVLCTPTLGDARVGPAAFTIGNTETPASNLGVSASNSMRTLAPVSKISFSGRGTNRFVSVTPATDVSGSREITINVTDGST